MRPIMILAVLPGRAPVAAAVTALLMCVAGVGHAAPGVQGSESAVQFVVHGTSGGYDVAISKQLVTVFYFPEKVKTAIVPNQRDLWIQITNDTVALQPLREPLATNLNVDTETLHISIVLKTAPVEQANMGFDGRKTSKSARRLRRYSRPQQKTGGWVWTARRLRCSEFCSLSWLVSP